MKKKCRTVILILGLICIVELILNGKQIAFTKKRFFPPYLNNTRIFKYDSNSTSCAKILILTYMRSGSTLTGDIMQQDPQSFYLFEPFRLIAHDIRSGKEFSYLNGQTRVEGNFSEVAGRALDNFLQCKFEKIATNIWTRDVFLSLSLKAKEFVLCKKTYNTPGVRNNTRALIRCLKQLKSECLKSKFIVIKTIRLTMNLIKPIMEKYKDMKVIHLLRDPRSSIASQMGFMNVVQENKSKIADTICTRILNDIEDYRLLTYKYPERLYRVRYENLACDPIETSRTLYRFCDMNFSETVIHRIRALTENEKEEKGVMDIVKSNSCATAHSRLQKISDVTLLEKDSCHYLLEKLNLKQSDPITDIIMTV